MKLLAIETATEACSAALYIDGEILHREQIAPQKHSELILPMCEELLDEAALARTDLTALAFGRGPGSFTGVRIATGVIQGLGFALELPVAPVSSLAALAQGAFTDLGTHRVLAAIDARMDEVYWGAFEVDESGLMRLVGEETLCPPDQAPVPEGGGWFGAGTGWSAYEAVLRERLDDRIDGCEGQRFPLAHSVALLGADMFNKGLAVPAEQALPVYLRDNVAQKPKVG